MGISMKIYLAGNEDREEISPQTFVGIFTVKKILRATLGTSNPLQDWRGLR
jgi:hypothetical protein